MGGDALVETSSSVWGTVEASKAIIYIGVCACVYVYAFINNL